MVEPIKRDAPENTPPEKEDTPNPMYKQDSYQICVMGIPKFVTETDILKHIILPIFPNPEPAVLGIYKQQIKEVAFILFSNDAYRKEFVSKFSNTDTKFKYPRAKVSVYVAKPLQKSQFKTIAALTKKKEKREVTEVNEGKLENIENQVLPWRDIPYEEQIEKKKVTLQNTIEGFFKQIKGLQGGIMAECPFIKMIETDKDKLAEYRNKVELSIGYNSKNEIDIGFIKGKMESKKLEIDSVQDYPHISKEAKQISAKMLTLIREFSLSDNLFPHERILGKPEESKTIGFWRILQIRQSNKTSEIMLTVVYTKNAVPDTVESKINSKILEIFPINSQIFSHKIVSINVIKSLNTGGVDYDFNDPVETIGGVQFYRENLLGYNFEVSPLSFLQINTDVCEKLYGYVREIASNAMKTKENDLILFDLYCGIGTIGICMEKIASKIIGIEVVPQAIENAKKNAELNKLSHKTEYYCGKAESLIDEIAAKYENKPIIAIVDPPRCGLHKDVAKKIRTCKGLDAIIYVSCNQQSLVRDALYLCQPSKGRIKGPSFTGVSYAGADLFPYTPHTECIMLFKRYYNGSLCT